MPFRLHTRKFDDADLMEALPGTLAGLAARFEVARSTIHRRLVALEAAGYVMNEGGRPRLWTPTPTGAAFVSTASPWARGRRNVQGVRPYDR